MADRRPSQNRPGAAAPGAGCSALIAFLIATSLAGPAACASATTGVVRARPPVREELPIPAPEDDVDEHVLSSEAARATLDAELHLQAGEIVEAIALLREATMHDASSPHLKTRLGEALLALGDPERAEGAADEALVLEPQYVPALRLKGNARAVIGDSAGACTVLERALALAPRDRQTASMLAELLVERGELEKAERVIDALMEQEPGATFGFTTLARVFAERGEIDRALAHLGRALAREPADDDALQLRLGLLWARGRDEDAVAVARDLAAERGDSMETRSLLLTALALTHQDEANALARTWIDDDDSEGMRLLIADAFERAGRVDVAAAWLKAVRGMRGRAQRGRLALIGRNAHAARDEVCRTGTGTDGGTDGKAAADADVHVRDFAIALCARALVQTGAKREAVRLLDRAIREHASATLVDARVQLTRVGEPPTAEIVDAIDRLRRSAPLDADLLDTATRAREALGDVVGARLVLDNAIKARPGDWELTFALARHMERSGEARAAADLVEREFERGRVKQSTLNFLAYTLADHDLRADDARMFAWRAVLLDPLSGFVLDTFGWAQVKAGLIDEGLQTLTRADRLAPHEAEIQFHLAVAARSARRDKDARIAIQGALTDMVGEDEGLQNRIRALAHELGVEHE